MNDIELQYWRKLTRANSLYKKYFLGVKHQFTDYGSRWELIFNFRGMWIDYYKKVDNWWKYLKEEKQCMK